VNWVGQAAGRLREALAHIPWLDGWQSTIAQTPDWALLAAGPTFLMLFALLLRMTWPKLQTDSLAHAARTRSDPAPNPPRQTDASAPRRAEAPTAKHTLMPAPVESGRVTTSPSSTRDGEDNRSVRVFVSSTFLDMQRERDVLVRQTFPALRARFRTRGVELLEVDLRWGITNEQAESGSTLSICLQEIDRCRPYFIGLLGERYGWVPPETVLSESMKAAFPAIADGAGRSVTELEILHGVLSEPDRSNRALFFERDPNWMRTLDLSERAAFVAETDDAQARQADLKARIRRSGARLIPYASPDDIGAAVEAALGAALEARFHERGVPDPFEQTTLLHAAYARERRGIHIGTEKYLAELGRWVLEPAAPAVLITGASGGGKSALVANWLQARRDSAPNDIIFEHYLGASPDSADPKLLMRRLWEFLNRTTGETVDLPTGNAEFVELSEGLSTRLTQGSLHAERQGVRIVIALDGLDKLSAEQDLHWLPSILPKEVKLLASCIDGDAKDALLARSWTNIEIKPLSAKECLLFVQHTLERWGKGASPKHVGAILRHPLAGTPLFLKTLLDELRYSATHERLDERLTFYLNASDLADLFARILARLEEDCGHDLTSRALSLVWASRAGLEEAEIITVTGATPLAWAILRNGLGDALRDQQGRLTFSHDFLRQAVAKRYLPNEKTRSGFHRCLATRFDQRVDEFLERNERWSPDTPLTTVLAPVARQMEEVPFQLRAAEEWDLLEKWLEDINHFRWFRILRRGDAEWFEYWAPLMARGYDLPSGLCPLFEEALGDGSGKVDLALATNFLRFLQFASQLGGGAERLARSAAAAAERLCGPVHQDTFQMWGWVGASVTAKGDLDEAQKIQERSLEKAMQSLGANDPITIDCMSRLAETLQRRGNVQLALRMHKLAWEGRERLLGPDHKSTLDSMSWVAACQFDSGDANTATKLLRLVLERRERILGPTNSETLDAADNLAVALDKQGDPGSAQELQERTLAIRTRVFGPNHPKTIAATGNLAVMLGGAGRHREAKELLERVVAAETQSHGADHPSTLICKRQLAGALRALGDLAGARTIKEQVLEGTMKVLGPEHPDTLASLDSLAGTLQAMGDFSGASQIQRRSFEVKTRLLGSDHADTLATMNDLAGSLLEMGEIDEAKRMFEQLVETRTRTLGPDDGSTLTSMNNLAGVLSAAGDLEGARKVQEQALDRMTRTFGPDHETTLTTMNNLALTLSACGDQVGAHSLSKRVFDGLIRAVGAEHPSTLVAMCNLAESLHALGASEQADHLLERAHRSMVAVFGANHPRTRMAASNLAAGRSERAEALPRAGDHQDKVPPRRGEMEAERNSPSRAVEVPKPTSTPNNESTPTSGHALAEALADRFEEKSGSTRVVILQVDQLGFAEGATTAEIIGAEEDLDEQGRSTPFSSGRAKFLGLALCASDFAVEAATKLDVPPGEVWYFGMRPVHGPDGEPAILALNHTSGKKVLDGAHARPNDKWSPSCKFVFCVH